MKKIYSAYDRPEAFIVKALLESNGIKADVQDDQLDTLVGGVGYTEAMIPTVWIFEDAKYEEAYALLETYLKNKERDEVDSVWVCQNCHEESPETFEICWNCGEERKH